MRWDSALYELCKDFAAAVREFVHLARRYNRSTDKEQHIARVDERHAQLRELAQQMRLLGSKDLQQAAREVEHHVWWVREVCEGREDALAEYTKVNCQRFACAQRCTSFTRRSCPTRCSKFGRCRL